MKWVVPKRNFSGSFTRLTKLQIAHKKFRSVRSSVLLKRDPFLHSPERDNFKSSHKKFRSKQNWPVRRSDSEDDDLSILYLKFHLGTESMAHNKVVPCSHGQPRDNAATLQSCSNSVDKRNSTSDTHIGSYGYQLGDENGQSEIPMRVLGNMTTTSTSSPFSGFSLIPFLPPGTSVFFPATTCVTPRHVHPDSFHLIFCCYVPLCFSISPGDCHVSQPVPLRDGFIRRIRASVAQSAMPTGRQWNSRHQDELMELHSAISWKIRA
jgi:hypothetical protein